MEQVWLEQELQKRVICVIHKIGVIVQVWYTPQAWRVKYRLPGLVSPAYKQLPKCPYTHCQC